ncbi:BACK domain-containing protein, partial [Trichostrongylus colubriformis]
MADAACRDLVDEAKNYQLLQLSTPIRPDSRRPRTRLREPVSGEVLYVVGGEFDEACLAVTECFDPGKADPAWNRVGIMRKRRTEVGVAVLNNVLYAVGGRDGKTYSRSCERYNPATGQWSCDVALMPTRRSSLGTAVLGDFLYALGGLSDRTSLDVVECYDAGRNEWTRMAPMGTCRHGLSVSVLDGCLYAVGGSDGQSSLNSVERFDPRVVADMNMRRCGLGLAVANGWLYAVGGSDGTNIHDTVEVFDPDDEANQWLIYSNMNDRLVAVCYFQFVISKGLGHGIFYSGCSQKYSTRYN